MNVKFPLTLYLLPIALGAFLLYPIDNFAQTQPPAAQIDADRVKAFELIKQNRYLDALPLLEKIAATDPTDADFWAEYSLAVMAHSLTLDSAEARRRERLAARAIANKARKLGSENLRVLELIEKIPEDGGADFSANSEVNRVLLEAERYFQSGDYEKALVAYERALKIDPKNYEATVYAGDTFYARKRYKEAEPWFARAAAIDPDREVAHRFWGDALMLQGKMTEARDKYVEAVVAEPYLRLTIEKLMNWAEESHHEWSLPPVIPPGGKEYGAIEFDEKLLKVEDGTNNWLLYRLTREAWQKQLFKREFPAALEYRHTLREETAALRAVVEAVKSDLKTGKIKKLDEGLASLIEINDAGMLEAYVLLPRTNEQIGEDYVEYRKTNRDKIRRFIVEFLISPKDKIKVE